MGVVIGLTLGMGGRCRQPAHLIGFGQVDLPPAAARAAAAAAAAARAGPHELCGRLRMVEAKP